MFSTRGSIFILSFAITLNSCGGGDSSSSAITGGGSPTSSPTLISISVTPASPTISKGATEQFTANGAYSDGMTRDITSTVVWTSSSAAVAIINSSGLARGAGDGTAAIKAASGSMSGSTILTVMPLWTWISGVNTINQPGIYGVRGTSAPANVPGGRWRSVSWTDGSGNLWLFGGDGDDANGSVGDLNDLWKFDGTNWIWISGATIVNQGGIYGVRGSSAPANVPGGRWGSVSWVDGRGNLWLFGGDGNDANGLVGDLNDLWKFDGTNWTWVSGAKVIKQGGTYATSGTADPANMPGAREDSVSWIDGSGNLWFFGGAGYDSTGSVGVLNDLWKFDGTNWTWVSGAKVINRAGTYATSGTADPANMPGARDDSVSWIDGSGNLWLFGGYGYDSSGSSPGDLNDLWKFDGTNWTWISGATIVNQGGIYGARGSASSANVPGARDHSVSWIDRSGNLWLFGGYGYDSNGSYGGLNDLWKFDGTNWTWISGATIVNQGGIYGARGSASSANVPGARGSAASWIDGSGSLWLFGGKGYDSSGSFGGLNDLWRYQP